MKQRRVEAARIFTHDASQTEVVHSFGVSAHAASVWCRRRQGGQVALREAEQAATHGCPRRNWTRLNKPYALSQAFSFDTELDGSRRRRGARRVGSRRRP
jgi:hypothetical protein